MKYFVEILKQFSQAQRLLVLVLLLFFTTGGIVLTQYLKTSDCQPLIEENLALQRDFVKISEMLRKKTIESNEMVDSSVVEAFPPTNEIIKDNSIMDSVLVIAESHIKK